ncbi:PREDICTED: NACHT, LRR and PYD domains-containing protein 2 [Mandrillus leucophaeus]|uniref:NACHT, LRR and PYD domains-containing protein 2 n=1 Tax=Mandrillus leucophaeus TaxID=9568 RepID=UPI0005F47F47|nr:PREDICTED: NACHT, LRR and PYD domains-containing protein 2 [Mandrillus leucophaeus]
MVSSTEVNFNLQALLEQLSQDELSKFKSLLRTVSLGNEVQKIPQNEVDEADGKQLAEILISHCHSYWTELATIQVFEKMHRVDLSERAKDELREAALKSFNKNKPLSLGITRKEREPVDVEEMLERFKAGTLDNEDRYRLILKTKFREMWQSWPGDSKEVDVMAERYRMLIPFSNPRVLPGPFSHTVVLHSPAGLGKTTLANKLMLDWTEDNLIQKFKYAFYLSCRELSRLGPCSFAEMVFRDWPELQDDMPHILAQAQKILFVIDGFDELGAPPGALIQDICGDWEQQKPVPVLLGSLLKRKMLPKATLLVTTRPRALRDLRFLAEQPIYIRVEGFLEEDRRAYFLRHFGDEDQAMRAFELMRSNAALFQSQDDQDMLPFWTDLCSVFGSNKDLMSLEINNSFLSASLVKILCEQIASDNCHLQRLVCSHFSHRLVSCSATTQQWADLSLALEANQSLMCVNLSDNELLDEGAKLLYTTLRHPKCFLQRLSLENCHLTEANCKDLAAVLVVSRELTHLCLAKNSLKDTGVKFLCEGLSYPECKLQALVLWNCDITSDGCCSLAKLLQEKSSLSCLDLGLNHIGVTGVKVLCEALSKPLCNLRCLWLWGCSIPPFSCEDLCSALSCNQSLITLDLGQNPLGSSGVKMLFKTLTRPGTLQTLRLKIDDFNDELHKLLEEIEENNPQLIIDTEKHDPWKKRPSSHDFMI